MKTTNLLVHDDVDFNAFSGLFLEKTIKAPFREIGWRSSKVQLRAKPPILSYNGKKKLINSKGE